MGLGDRFQNAWNAFMNRDPTTSWKQRESLGRAYSDRPDRVRLTPVNERSIINSIYNRIAIDVASIQLLHARLDSNNRYIETIDSGLNNVFSVSANIDQTGRAFVQDMVMSMLDEGSIAVIPIDTDDDPDDNNSYQIFTMRVGKIVEWFPQHVKVRAYNDRTGRHEERLFRKDKIAVLENPFYSVMNEPNSTLKRLCHKLALLDLVDEQSSSGKLDLIIQLPYVIKSEARRNQAEERRKEIEMQLSGSRYGIAYTDGTEKITQLNRSLENNLLAQIESLTSTLYSQLSMTDEIMKGTADEQTMLNYYNRTVEPILSVIADEFKRKFITPTALTQKQSIVYFRDPFKLAPVSQIAEIADKFTRNAILSSNEIRGIVGFKPVDDVKANELSNKNLNESEGQHNPVVTEDGESSPNGGNLMDTPITNI